MDWTEGQILEAWRTLRACGLDEVQIVGGALERTLKYAAGEYDGPL